MVSDIRICEGLSDLSDSYMGWILDQWGVLHDGNKPYDGVIEALQELKKRKKQIILLSNSGKRAKTNADRLEKIGFDVSLFTDIITSGEMTWQGLKNRDEGIFKGLGDQCLLFSRQNDTAILDGCGISVVDTVEKADFILMSGIDRVDKQLSDYEPYLREGVRKGLKMICANPDMRALMGAQTYLGPGQVAKKYADFGGVVHYIGKPHAPIYRTVMARFTDVLPSQMVMVGDSLGHDILGAAQVGLDACLVGTGVHAAAYKQAQSMDHLIKILSTLAVNYGVRPNFFVSNFIWGKALPDRKNRRKKTS